VIAVRPSAPWILGLAAGLAVALAAALTRSGPLVLLGVVGLIAVFHRPAFGLAALLLLLPLSPGFDGTLAPVVNNALPVLVLAAWITHRLHDGRPIRGFPGVLDFWFLLFIGWTLIAGCFSRDFTPNAFRAIRYLLLGGLLIVFRDVWTSRQLGRALLVYAAVLVPAGLFGVWQMWQVGFQEFLYGRLWDPRRLSSIYGNANSFGVLMGNGIVLLAACCLAPRAARVSGIGVRRLVLGFGLVLLFAGLFVSLSRSAYLYVLTAIVVLSLSHRRLRRGLALAAVLVAVALIVLPLPEWLVTGLRLQAGVSYRDALWSFGWTLLRAHPWTGVGAAAVDGYRRVYMESGIERAILKASSGGAHNVFLTKGAELGWPGVLLTLSLFLLFLRRVPSALASYREGSWLSGAAAASVVGLSVRGLVESGTTLGTGHLDDSLFFFLSGLVLLGRPAARTPARVVVTAPNFRSDRTGGQMVWKDLVDRWKAAGHPVLCEDEHPTPASIRERPILHALWYLLTYGSLRSGVFVADQSDGQRLGLLLRSVRAHRRVRILVVVHHLREGFRYRHPLYVRLASWNETSILRLADRVVVHTQAGATQVAGRGVKENRIALIPLGIRRPGRPISVRSLRDDEPLRLLWVGGDFTRKGLDVLLEALHRIPEPRPIVTVVGQPLGEATMAQAEDTVGRLGLGSSVTFLGFVPPERLEPLWHDHDAYVLPSLHEGHGLALDEALVRGLPAVASDLPVFRERLRPDEALFVPRGDPAALARALVELRDESFRRQLSARGLARAQTYPRWEETLDRYEALLRAELETVS
jgi:glycosyltransferase involved in cell wall biosynthesis/O-antigen ligase